MSHGSPFYKKRLKKFKYFSDRAKETIEKWEKYGDQDQDIQWFIGHYYRHKLKSDLQFKAFGDVPCVILNKDEKYGIILYRQSQAGKKMLNRGRRTLLSNNYCPIEIIAGDKTSFKTAIEELKEYRKYGFIPDSVLEFQKRHMK